MKDYYVNIKENENKEPNILDELPSGQVDDIWSRVKRKCANWLEFMYNNPNQPNSSFGYRGGLFIPCGFIDSSKANRAKNLGSMKEIWKEFEKHIKHIDFNAVSIGDIERQFWDFYIKRHKDRFNHSVKLLEDHIKKKRQEMSDDDKKKEKEHYPFLTDDIWERGCSDCLRYLIETKTTKGFVIELVFFKTVEQILGGEFIESTADYEKRGIDGLVLYKGYGYPACIKPHTFKGGISPIYEDRYIEYERVGDDLVFTFKTGKNLLNLMKDKL